MMRGAGLVALLSGLAAWGLTGDPDEADEWRLLRRREGYEDAREVLLQWTTYEDVSACVRAYVRPSQETYIRRKTTCSRHPFACLPATPACLPTCLTHALPLLPPPPTPPTPPSFQWRAMVAKMVEWIWVVRRILSLPEVASLFLADSLVYFVIKGLADWSVLALTETKGLGEKEAVGVFFYCELGAIFGSFASGKDDTTRHDTTRTFVRRSLLSLPSSSSTKPITHPHK